MSQQVASGRKQAQHLSFYRTGGKCMRQNPAGPRSRAVDDLRREKGCLLGGDSADSVRREIQGGYRIARRKIHSPVFGGGERRGSQRSRIDTAFLQIKCSASGFGDDRLKFGQRRRQGKSRKLAG